MTRIESQWSGGVLNLDLEGSSVLAKRVRDGERWRQAHASFTSWMDRLAEKYGVLRQAWAGDGYVGLFTNAETLLACARTLLTELDQFNSGNKSIDWDLKVRLGADWGTLPPLGKRSLGEITADALNRAGHLQKAAAANQLRISNTFREQLGELVDDLVYGGVDPRDSQPYWTWSAKPVFEDAPIPFRQHRAPWAVEDQIEDRCLNEFRRAIEQMRTTQHVEAHEWSVYRALDLSLIELATDPSITPQILNAELAVTLKTLVPTLDPVDVYVLNVGLPLPRHDPVTTQLIARWAGEFMVEHLVRRRRSGKLTMGLAAGRSLLQMCRALARRNDLPPMELRALDMNAEIDDLGVAAPMMVSWIEAYHGKTVVKAVAPLVSKRGRPLSDQERSRLLDDLDICVLGVGNNHRLRRATLDRLQGFDPGFIARINDPKVYGGDILLFPIEHDGRPITSPSGEGGNELIDSLSLEDIRFLVERDVPVYALTTGLARARREQVSRGEALQAVFIRRLCQSVGSMR